MKIKVTKLTDVELARKACQFTLHSHNKTKVGLDKLYGSEHSPARTQLLWVEMYDIPSFVSTHFVRHKIGVEHYVQTNRVDRGGSDDCSRNSSVNHAMLINAQALINIARKRLCTQASKETREVMQAIKDSVKEVDEDLAKYMVVDCDYRGGKCYEFRCCGRCIPAY